jgi:uncharacterized protein (DUF885 family)
MPIPGCVRSRSYYLDERAILEAGAGAERARGSASTCVPFTMPLELGSVPLPVLEERVRRFIAEGGRGPYPEMEQ